jgi:hypothetical protein
LSASLFLCQFLSIFFFNVAKPNPCNNYRHLSTLGGFLSVAPKEKDQYFRNPALNFLQGIRIETLTLN